ncbi:MAG: serine/threonine protein kinase [Deltaproteobacteria bacterium]|nr:serine/threonine protein kinase [Deltaproteobacteria bacterium]
MNVSLLHQRYQPLRLVATGPYGEVQLARQVGASGLGREVTLKRVSSALSGDPRGGPAFLEQMALAVRLTHPNVAAIYDLLEEPEGYVIVSEHVRGVDLGLVGQALHGAGRTLPFEHCVTVGLALLEALRHAHHLPAEEGADSGMVHGGLAPTNVLVSYEGAVKVTDFGLAQAQVLLDDAATVPDRRAPYLSPELAEGRLLEPSSDLFSVGAILYELAVGQPAFRAASLEELRRAVRRSAPPPTYARAGFPADLEQILMRALERLPEERYHHAEAMEEALERFADEAGLRRSPLRLGRFLRQLMGVAEGEILQVVDTEEQEERAGRGSDELVFDWDGTGDEAASPGEEPTGARRAPVVREEEEAETVELQARDALEADEPPGPLRVDQTQLVSEEQVEEELELDGGDFLGGGLAEALGEPLGHQSLEELEEVDELEEAEEGAELRAALADLAALRHDARSDAAGSEADGEAARRARSEEATAASRPPGPPPQPGRRGSS